MKQILVFLLATSITYTLQAQGDAPYLTKSLKEAGIEHVLAETSGGNISITGDAAAEPRIEVYIRSGGGKIFQLSKEEIQKKLNEDYELSITTVDHKLTAIAKPKNRNASWNWRKSLSISFKIYVPRNVSTNLTTSGGNLDLAHLTGTQDFRTSGGNLQIDDLAGKIKGVTSGGNIHLKDSKDDITLSTSGGNIDAKNSSGKLKLTTSGGNVTLEELTGNIDATTSGGSVRGNVLSGELSAVTSGGNVTMSELSCSITASTSGGNITVSVKELGSFVKLSNSGGNINLDIPGNKGLDLKISGDKVKVNSLNNFSGKIEDDSIDGKINGGGIPVTVRGNGGRVSLSIK